VSPPPDSSIYSATKGALDNITISLQRAGARKIRVSSLHPRRIETEDLVAVGAEEGV
jgi:3-oxoacyl-[acyl-carrier protein] reductase